jgi:UMF1 family MFS transporter
MSNDPSSPSPAAPPASPAASPAAAPAGKGEVRSWALYDLANQSFTLLINTLLFPIYFKLVLVPASSSAGSNAAARGESLWGLLVAASLLIVAFGSPLIGAWADIHARKKLAMTISTIVCIAGTLGLAFVPPGSIALAAVVYVVAAVAFAFGENFLASFLPEISDRRSIARVSSFGWTMGYVGALALLILTAIGMAVFNTADPASWRPYFIFAGLWYLVMALPCLLMLRERAKPTRLPPGVGLVRSVHQRMMASIRTASKNLQLLRFLGVFFVYGMGVQTFIFFAAILAESFGFRGTRLVLFLLPTTITAGIGAALAPVLQRRLGHRSTIHVFLGVWLATCCGLLWLTHATAANPGSHAWLLWTVAAFMGLSLGGIGTASRAIVGAFTPPARTAEVFGLWGLVYRLAAVVGVGTFGLVRAQSATGAVWMLIAFFAAAALLLLLVSESKGLRESRPGMANDRA